VIPFPVQPPETLACPCGNPSFTLLMEGGAKCCKCSFVMPLVWHFDFDPSIHSAEREE